MNWINYQVWCNMLIVIVAYFVALQVTVLSKHHVRICGKINHNGTNGELLPHDGIIPSGYDCNWHIFPESFNIPEVYMVIEDFRLNVNDRFTIKKHDGETLFGPLNGTKETFTILTGYLFLDVSVDIENSLPQDRHFKSFFTTNACYYLIEEEAGSMTSPLYHDVNHRKNVTCTWQFRKFKQVTLPRTVVFETFHLTNSTLTVKGSKAQDGVYSGTKLPENIIAFGETQFILHLNTSVPGETFSFRYGLNAKSSPENDFHELSDDNVETSTIHDLKGNSHACGIINLRGITGRFMPKDDTITAHHSCVWTIESGLSQDSPGIYVVIEDYDLINDDSFVLRKSSSVGTALFGPYFGKEGRFSIFTDELKVTAVLETRDSEWFTKRHFSAYYSTGGCTYTITNNNGIIHSPFYKTNNQKETACNWKFNQADTSVISISFDSYNIKSSHLQVEGSINQDQVYKASDGPFDILMKANGVLTLMINRTIENEMLTFSYNNVTPACSNYIKIIGKENASLSFPPLGTNINSFDCQWIIEGTQRSVLAVNFDEIHLADAQDFLLIKEGKTRNSPVLVQITQNNARNVKGHYVVSSTNVIWVSFNTRFAFKGSHFKMNVNISEQGGHLYNAQNFTIKPRESGIDLIYFLEVKTDEQVLLSLYPEQKLPSIGVILVYNGFTVNASLLTKIKHDKLFYPIASTGSKMMIVARGFDKNSSVKLRFKGVAKGCHQVTLDQRGTFSLSGNCNSTCSWAILPKANGNQEMLSLHLSSIALTPDDVIEVKQLDDNMTHIASVTLKENHMPNIYLPVTYGAYIKIVRGECVVADSESTAFSASVEVLRGCSVNIDINANENVYLTSPNHPDTYPINSHCFWNVSTRAKNLYLSFKNFQLASGHCLKIHEIDNGHILDTVTYSSSVIPIDKMLKNNIALELLASQCSGDTALASSGNGFLVEVFALDCGGVLGKELRGTFSSPDFPKPVMKSLLCIWKVEVPFHSDNRSVNVVSFDIKWSSASTDNETGLIIHDGPSLTNEIITNTSTTTKLMSKTNSLVFIYKQENTDNAHSAVKVNFESRTGNTLCDNGIYMHPDWVCNDIDECGDYSDEKNCKGHAPLPPPVPPAPPLPPNVVITKTGVSKVVFWSVVPVMFFVGILSSVLAAFIVKEIRRRREANYDSLPILQ